MCHVSASSVGEERAATHMWDILWFLILCLGLHLDTYRKLGRGPRTSPETTWSQGWATGPRAGTKDILINYEKLAVSVLSGTGASVRMKLWIDS